MPETIKTIVEGKCPHCEQPIFVESSFTPGIVGEIFTKKQMEEAKEDCVKRIDALSIDDNKKEEVIKWINDPITVFAPGEIESIILSLLKPNELE